MKKNKKQKTQIGDLNDYIKANRRASRNEAFERNGGGQFVSLNKIHKNKKKYDRKRDKKIFDIDLSLYFLCEKQIFIK